MIIEEKTYNEQEYEGLVVALMESPFVGKELTNQKESMLLQNPLFYPLLFRAVDKIRDSAKLEGNRRLLANLEDFEIKLMEYTNIFPVDLPDAILADKELGGKFLADYAITATSDADWLKFKNKIFDQLETLPSESKLTFLEWCNNMMDMNWKRHKKTCRAMDCVQDKGYTRRVSLIRTLIDEAKPQPTLKDEILENQPVLEYPSTKKIQWLGTQKELAELFIRLRAKGWITDFEPETIKECFTKSDSIHQILKPGEYTEDLGGTFEQVFTPEYVSKFHGVMPNPKRN